MTTPTDAEMSSLADRVLAAKDGVDLPWSLEQAQDGEYTGPADNPPGYAGDWYDTNNVVAYSREPGEVIPIADGFRKDYSNYIVLAANAAPALAAEVKRLRAELARRRDGEDDSAGLPGGTNATNTAPAGGDEQ